MDKYVYIVFCNKQPEFTGSLEGALEWVKQGLTTDLGVDSESDRYQIKRIDPTPFWD